MCVLAEAHLLGLGRVLRAKVVLLALCSGMVVMDEADLVVMKGYRLWRQRVSLAVQGRRRGGRRARPIGAVGQHGGGKDGGSWGASGNASSSAHSAAEGAEAAEVGADPQVASSEERMDAWKELMGDRHYLRSQAGFSGCTTLRTFPPFSRTMACVLKVLVKSWDCKVGFFTALF